MTRFSVHAKSETPPLDLLENGESLAEWISAAAEPLERVADLFLLERCVHEEASARGEPLEDDEAAHLHSALRAAAARAMELVHERQRRELRGPLTVALAAGSLLHEQAPSEELRHLAARAISSLQRIEARLGERVSRGPIRCELEPLVRGLVEEMMIVHGPRFVLYAEPVEALVDAPELRCALHELLERAAKRSGVVELRVSRHGSEVWVRLRGDHESAELGELLRACAEHHHGRVDVEPGSLTLVLPGSALAVEA